VYAKMTYPFGFMTFLYDLPLEVVPLRNIDVLAFGEKQTIFDPKSQNLALLEKLDHKLGK